MASNSSYASERSDEEEEIIDESFTSELRFKPQSDHTDDSESSDFDVVDNTHANYKTRPMTANSSVQQDPAELQSLFAFIDKYTPMDIELVTALFPFIPEYIPAIGDIDAFIKVPEPDCEDDGVLGLVILDEPCAEQSNATLLELQLRAMSKASHVDYKTHSIESKRGRSDNKELNMWIKNSQELSGVKQSGKVKYARKMPDVEQLMQAWANEVEPLMIELAKAGLTIDKIDVIEVKELARIVCAVMDVPVGEDKAGDNATIQSLHLLFEVYAAFKQSQHFS